MGAKERSQARDICEPTRPETPEQRQRRIAAEFDENTEYGTPAPRCPATFMSWPNGRIRCQMPLGHPGSHR